MRPGVTRPAIGAVPRVLLALSTALVAGCSGTDPSGAQERTFDDVPEPLIVEGGEAEIALVASSDIDGVRVTRQESGQAGGEWALEDDALSLGAECVLFSRCHVRYVVEVPAKTHLSVSTGNGLLSLTGFTSRVEVTSGNGPVLLSDASGPIDLSSSNGDLTLDGITSDTVRLATDNGGVDATFAERPAQVEVSTNDGDATLALPEGPYAVFETVDNGEVVTEVDVDSSAQSTISARTENGTITLSPVE